MGRIPIQFTGLTSNANHKDGECSNIVNLRPKNGYLKPVPPRKDAHILSNNYDIIFVHKAGDKENWIGVYGSDIYSNITGNRVFIGRANEDINSVMQIGNTLSFVANTNIYYALWTESSYKYLGVIPDLPVVSFDTPAMETVSRKYTDEYDVRPSTSVDKRTELTDMTKGLMYVIKDKNNTKFQDAFFVRYALRLYDGSIIRPSSPILVMPRDGYKTWATAYLPRGSESTYLPDSEVRLKMFMLNASYDFSSLEQWKDIIKSVDFFTTPYIGLASPEEIASGWYSRNQNNVYNLIYPSIRDSSSNDYDTVEDKVLKTTQFYLYYSETDFEGQKTESFPNKKKVTVKDNYSNIINQEYMEVSSISNHNIGAMNASVYNSRLRLSDIITTLFSGYSIRMYNWGSDYNGISRQYAGVSTKSMLTRVTLKTEQGEYIVANNAGHGSILFTNAFISYPDSRATRIEVYFSETSGYNNKVLDIALSPHPSLDIAYALNDNLSPYVNEMESLSGATPHYDSKPTLVEPNKLKVSALNNPFSFPNINTYHIGTGKILAESSIIMNVSDRNYGMYPMFVFTDSGVFTMSGQTADTVHESIQAPTYLEPPISNVICATPYGVCFITKRGLMVINQNSTDFISDALRENDDEIVIHNINEVQEDIINYPYLPFTEFLESVDMMLYNPYNDELIISSEICDYSYVYDFPSQSFYLSTEKFTDIVNNSFPKIYVIDGVKIKNYAEAETPAANVSLITRPLSFGTTDIKTLERVWLRALLYNTTKMSVAAFQSMDGVNFFPIKGLMFGQSNGNYLDVDLGLLSRSTYKHYTLLLAGTVDEQSQIRYAEFEVDKRYNNEKMR